MVNILNKSSKFYFIVHLSLWISSMLTRLLVILLLLIQTHKSSFATSIITSIMLEKASTLSLTFMKNKRISLREFIIEVFDLKNLDSLFSSNSFYFSNHKYLLFRVMYNIIAIQYNLFYQQEILNIDNKIVQSITIAIVLINFVQSASLQCLLYTNVNDFLFTTNYAQVPLLMIQSLSMLLIESLALTQQFSFIYHYFIIKIVFTIIQISICKIYNFTFYDQNTFLGASTSIITSSLIWMPYNYMPFIDYLKVSACIRDKCQFHDSYLKFGRLTQFIQQIIFIVMLSTQDTFQRLSLDSMRNIIVYITLANICYNLIYTADLLYRKVSQNHIYFFKSYIKVDELLNILKKSPNLKFLEVQFIENINYVNNQYVNNRFELKANMDKHLTLEQKQIIFNLLFWQHPNNEDFKITIGQLIQIYNKSAGYYCYGFYSQLIDTVENRKNLANRYLLSKDFVSNQEQHRYSEAIINRIFKFGYTNQIELLYKTYRNSKIYKNIFIEFQSQLSSTILFFQNIPECIPMNPHQLYYDLYD